MSQYLNLYLKEKEKDTSISLGYFCTTPARQIESLGAFPYTENDTLLTQDSIKSYLSIITEERDKCRKYLEEYVQKKEEIKQNLYKCISKDVAQMFLGNIEDIEQSILELKEIINDWNWIIDKISFMSDIWEKNQENWNLYYSNC